MRTGRIAAMPEENYLSLQPSKSVIAHVASSIFAAYLRKGKTNDANDEEYIRKPARLAFKIASHTDAIGKNDGEWMTEKTAGAVSLL